MGMFDEIVVEVPLPGTPPDFIKPGHRFQTKDLSCELKVYTIQADGALLPGMSDFTGTIDFYTTNIRASGPAIYTANGEDAVSVEYRATFVEGKLTTLEETSREVKPAFPYSKMPGHAPPTDAEPAAWKRREAEPMVGRTVYLLWGGQRDGYSAEVIAENGRQLVLRKASGEFEVVHRGGRDHTLFDSEAEARASRLSKNDEWERGRKEYSDYVAARAGAGEGTARR